MKSTMQFPSGAIAVTGGCFQRCAVKERDPTSAVFYDASVLQRLSEHRHARSFKPKVSLRSY